MKKEEKHSKAPTQKDTIFTLTTAILFIILVILLSVFSYKYSKINKELTKTDEDPIQREENLVSPPKFQVTEFPPATVGMNYETDLIVYVLNSGEISMKYDKLPDGLSMADCKTTTNTDALPQPNSILRCLIKGVPSKSGNYTIQFDAGNPSGRTNTVNDIKIKINEPGKASSTN